MYRELLDSLGRYIRSHFRIEEGCMEQYRCPVARNNKEAHARFVEVLSGFQERYAQSGYDPAEACSLVDTVDRWLSDHICRVDVHLKECVKKAEPFRSRLDCVQRALWRGRLAPVGTGDSTANNGMQRAALRAAAEPWRQTYNDGEGAFRSVAGGTGNEPA